MRIAPQDGPAKQSQPKLTGTVDEAAQVLGIGRNYAYEMVKRGEIPARRMGTRIIVLWQPLMRMLNGAST